MPNMPRPKCPTCGTAMNPLFKKGPRGKAFIRPSVPGFECCGNYAVGRKATQFMEAKP